MTAFRPISPPEATKLIEAAQVGVDAEQLIADLAEAGLVRGYARLVKREGSAQPAVRDARIPPDLWGRIIREGRVREVYATGTVRLHDGAGETSVIGIRFDEQSIRSAASAHGQAPAEPSPYPVPTERKAHASLPTGAVEPHTLKVIAASDSLPRRKPMVEIPDGAMSLTVLEAAAALRIGKTTVYRLANEGLLEMRKIGGRSVVTVASIKERLGTE